MVVYQAVSPNSLPLCLPKRRATVSPSPLKLVLKVKARTPHGSPTSQVELMPANLPPLSSLSLVKTDYPLLSAAEAMLAPAKNSLQLLQVSPRVATTQASQVEFLQDFHSPLPYLLVSLAHRVLPTPRLDLFLAANLRGESLLVQHSPSLALTAFLQ
jgi:hypothetical protein